MPAQSSHAVDKRVDARIRQILETKMHGQEGLLCTLLLVSSPRQLDPAALTVLEAVG